MASISLIRQRGLFFLVSWGHRISGIFLVVFLGFHIQTLTLLRSPELYNARMSLYSSFPISVLVAVSSLPVIFHALNGGRLMLYESLGIRKNDTMFKLVVLFSAGYGLIVFLLPELVSDKVSPLLFWIPVFIAGLFSAGLWLVKMLRTGAGPAWKLQRITAGFLLILIPCHVIFMHHHPESAHSAHIVIGRLQLGFINMVDTVLTAAVLYHAAYGLMTVLNDYGLNRVLRRVLLLANLLIVVLSAWIGIGLLWTV